MGDILHGREFVDYSQNEIIAWGFAIEKDDVLDIEELFVRPNWRRHGYGIKLAKCFTQLSAEARKPLRAWIPHPDIVTSNYPALNAIIHHLSLSLEPSPVKWASKVGL